MGCRKPTMNDGISLKHKYYWIFGLVSKKSSCVEWGTVGTCPQSILPKRQVVGIWTTQLRLLRKEPSILKNIILVNLDHFLKFNDRKTTKNLWTKSIPQNLKLFISSSPSFQSTGCWRCSSHACARWPRRPSRDGGRWQWSQGSRWWQRWGRRWRW